MGRFGLILWVFKLVGSSLQKMFASETSAVVKSVGAEENLISNTNLNQKVDLLTLVRVREGKFFEYPKYTAVDCTLPELIEEEEEFSPEVEEELLVKDFKTSLETKGSGQLGGGVPTVGEANVSASSDTVDGLADCVSIKKKTAVLKGVRAKFDGRKLKKAKLKQLRLKDKDRLAFVHQTVYNTGPVKMIKKSSQDGSISASYQKFVKLLFKGSIKEETSFTVPEKSTFAYGLQEIVVEEEKMEIPLEPWTNKKNYGFLTHDSIDSDLLQQVREGVSVKEFLLKPLRKLPESTCKNLLEKLQEVLEEGGALSLLEETLDQSSKGDYERPKSKAVSSLMDLLDKSKESSNVKDAMHLLVSAMEALPEGAVRTLTSGSPETLAVLSQMVQSLKDGGDVSLPESPPVSLQQDGELRWAADLLCSSDETLTELSESWTRPPDVLLEVVALTVLGVHILQHRE
ncbi:PREDICTED: uncharacterized protein LOC107101267 [Cyprinodon variegatus]|uniref:uncharacterized protein LOC107101267 n=1 Tax=Cyprinodon variegatus TaxID=28743 RepID=UPI0007428762|nr:PREDICTED: uncharacterized protein LOC107101267 [Cyprinodon variegatus]